MKSEASNTFENIKPRVLCTTIDQVLGCKSILVPVFSSLHWPEGSEQIRFGTKLRQSNLFQAWKPYFFTQENLQNTA
ncbi:hypothetical protein CEXT_693151 [Caerostris extrusa]|uniref:Uncharacterized protein n=1 Tax=Caerostris extrusa TaxID=172846 RepID=A0AAV4T2C1_CAEEX|nr:hypothetical protein CEXT_693151 [Caerostris extrusa]